MKAGQTQLPECYEWYSEQIAGHHPSVVRNGEHQIGFIKEKGSEFLLKPVQEGIRGQCEVGLYDSINKCLTNDESKSSSAYSAQQRSLIVAFTRFLPKYYGLKTIYICSKEVKCLVLEDLTFNYKQPCTMDIKIGKVTYDPNATEAKRFSETVKYPAQEELGFRLLGYRMSGFAFQMHCVEGKPPRIRDKLWGRSRTLENIVEAYGEFLCGRADELNRVANEVLTQLRSIRQWFMEQTIYHFYASSILIVYEASMDRPPNAIVRLIDFSHVFAASGKPDENYLFGLNKIIDYIEQCIQLCNTTNNNNNSICEEN